MADDNPGGNYYGDRWSLQLARPPGWLYREPGAVIDWYKTTIYDRADVDGNLAIQQLVDGYRQEAARRGLVSDQTDGIILQVVGEMAVGLTSWADIAALQAAGKPNTPTQTAGDVALAAAPLDVASVIAQSIARVGPPPAIPNQDAYGTVTTAGIEGSTAPPTNRYSGPPGNPNGSYANGPANVGGASGFPTTSSTPAASSLFGGLNPFYVAAGAVALYLLAKGKK